MDQVGVALKEQKYTFKNFDVNECPEWHSVRGLWIRAELKGEQPPVVSKGTTIIKELQKTGKTVKLWVPVFYPVKSGEKTSKWCGDVVALLEPAGAPTSSSLTIGVATTGCLLCDDETHEWPTCEFYSLGWPEGPQGSALEARGPSSSGWSKRGSSSRGGASTRGGASRGRGQRGR